MKPETTNAKQNIRSVEDDAPLFAGLDGFVFQQQEKPVAKKIKSPVEKKGSRKNVDVKPVATTKKKAAVPKPKPEKSEQPAKAYSLDADAILLSIREMCILLKISRATLVRMDNAGKIPGRMKLGGSVRFHRATVVAWLESMISPTNSPF